MHVVAIIYWYMSFFSVSCGCNRRYILYILLQLDVRRGPKEAHYDVSPKLNEEKGAASGDLHTAAVGDGDQDLVKALESISRIRKGLVAIQIQQLRDRRRLILYNEMNKTNRTEMLVASLAETAVFVIAAIFQIYFVRRWFVRKDTVLSSKLSA